MPGTYEAKFVGFYLARKAVGCGVNVRLGEDERVLEQYGYLGLVEYWLLKSHKQTSNIGLARCCMVGAIAATVPLELARVTLLGLQAAVLLEFVVAAACVAAEINGLVGLLSEEKSREMMKMLRTSLPLVKFLACSKQMEIGTWQQQKSPAEKCKEPRGGGR